MKMIGYNKLPKFGILKKSKAFNVLKIKIFKNSMNSEYYNSTKI